MKKPLDTAQKQEIEALYHSGESYSRIAHLVGPYVTVRQVNYHLTSNNLSRHPLSKAKFQKVSDRWLEKKNNFTRQLPQA